MQRDLEGLTERTFDVVVIGGGVVGASAALDASARGLSVALIEAEDFGGRTSANCLKIVHGGLRYLQSLSLRRMRESIVERRFWLQAAPHLVEPLPVLTGTYREWTRNRVAMRVAMGAADAVGFDRNKGVEPSRHLPAGRTLDSADAAELVPQLMEEGATGGALFYDALMYSPERLVLELVLGAAERGAEVANHVQYRAPIFIEGKLAGVEAEDTIGSRSFDIRTRSVFNAAGPWASRIAADLHRSSTPDRWRDEKRYSLALNLVLPGTEHEVGFSLRTSDPEYGSTGPGRASRRELFFVPWRGSLLVGTGHYTWDGGASLDGDLSAYRDRFLEEVNRAWPGTEFHRDDVALVHRGLLPADPDGTKVSLTSRHIVRSHSDVGLPNAVTAIGVKFTTGRLTAEEALDALIASSGLSARSTGRTSEFSLPGGKFESVETLRNDAESVLREQLDGDVIDHLVRTFGARWRRVVETGRNYPDWTERVLPGEPIIRGQFYHAVEEEMAMTVNDLIWRRTEIGPRGLDNERARRIASDVLRRCRSETEVV